MRRSIAEKKAITHEMHRRYRWASETDRAAILDELTALTGLS